MRKEYLDKEFNEYIEIIKKYSEYEFTDEYISYLKTWYSSCPELFLDVCSNLEQSGYYYCFNELKKESEV